MLQQNHSTFNKLFIRKLWSAFKIEREEERRIAIYGKIDQTANLLKQTNRVLERHEKKE